MLNALRKIYLHVYRPLRLVLDFDSLSSKKKMSETTNKPIEPTQLEKALKAVRDGQMTAYKACKLYSVNSGTEVRTLEASQSLKGKVVRQDLTFSKNKFY
jgi:hypothetical protein